MQRRMGNWFVQRGRAGVVRRWCWVGVQYSVPDFVRRLNPRGEAGPGFVAEQLSGGQLALGCVFAEFGIEKGVVETGPCRGGGAATEINRVEARPVRGGKAHGARFAAGVERTAGQGKSAQCFARGADGIDFAVSRWIIRCRDRVCTFAHYLARAHDYGSKRAAFAGDDILCCECDGPSEELWIW